MEWKLRDRITKTFDCSTQALPTRPRCFQFIRLSIFMYLKIFFTMIKVSPHSPTKTQLFLVFLVHVFFSSIRNILGEQAIPIKKKTGTVRSTTKFPHCPISAREVSVTLSDTARLPLKMKRRIFCITSTYLVAGRFVCFCGRSGGRYKQYYAEKHGSFVLYRGLQPTRLTSSHLFVWRDRPAW